MLMHKKNKLAWLFITGSVAILSSSIVVAASLSTNYKTSLINCSNIIASPYNESNSLTFANTYTSASASTFFSCEDESIVPSGDIYYEINGTSITIITGTDEEGETLNTLSGTNLILKSNFKVGNTENCNIVTIDDYAFINNNEIKSSLDLTNDTSLTTIGKSAFSECNNLNTVKFPENLQTISENAFKGCPNLKTIDLTKTTNVLTINDYAFAKDYLINVSYIDNDKYMLYHAKNGQVLVDKTTLDKDSNQWSNTTKAIGSIAVGNINLQNASCTEITDNAFTECYGVNSIDFPETLEKIGESAFSECRQLSSLVFNNGLKIIEKSAFSACHNLDYINFPESTQFIDQLAFDDIGVDEIVFNNKNPDWLIFDPDNNTGISPDWLGDDNCDITIYVPYKCDKAYRDVLTNKCSWFKSDLMKIVAQNDDSSLLKWLWIGLGVGIPVITAGIVLIVFFTNRNKKKNANKVLKEE